MTDTPIFTQPEWRAPVDADANICIAEHRSQAGQDLFVIAMTQGKRQGTWLEIGCGTPDYHNNTYLLEKQLGWSGISIDISAEGYGVPNSWERFRPRGQLVIADACTIDYSQFAPSFDYLQVDVATPLQNLEVLDRVIKTQRFAVITYEHDAYSCGDGMTSRARSRELLTAAGYDLVVGDVWCPKDTHAGSPEQDTYFEDWWVDPAQIPSEIREAYRWHGDYQMPKYFMEIFFGSR